MQNQQMQNMMNLANNFMQMQPIIFDPRKIDDRMRKQLANTTIYQVKNGLYQKFPIFKLISFSYIPNYDPGVPNNICDVEVVYDHVLDAAEKYADKGVNYSMTSGLNPIVVNVVGKEFNGSNLELCQNMRDQIINIRTTFCSAVGTHPPFPIKEDECVYSKLITVVKTKYPTTFLAPQDTYRIGLITVAPLQIKKERLLSDNKMCSEDFAKTLIIIECIFQAAISRNHYVLVLPPFGHEDDNNPVDDIVKIYNYCIYKYGHMFKKIIIGIPQFYPKPVFDAYVKGIIKPIELVNIIDKKYEQDDMKNSLMKTSADKKKEVKQEQQPNQNNMDPQQMAMFMKMMQQMMNKQ